MNILDKIISHKRSEVNEKKTLYPTPLLERSIYFEAQTVSLKSYLKNEQKSGIIAEFKRRSPSKGYLNPYASVETVTIGYMQAGASALSVLTDTNFFSGKNEDLTEARKFNFCPILRKDFIIDEYQIVEARAIGADVILLIAECLSRNEVKKLSAFAKSLGLQVLLEIHSEGQLEKLTTDIDFVGVNNRNLNDFSVDISTSLKLAEVIPSDFIKISESGLSNPSTIITLKRAGYDGFLIGEYFMKHANPAKAAANLIDEMNLILAKHPIA